MLMWVWGILSFFFLIVCCYVHVLELFVMFLRACFICVCVIPPLSIWMATVTEQNDMLSRPATCSQQGADLVQLDPCFITESQTDSHKHTNGTIVQMWKYQEFAVNVSIQHEVPRCAELLNIQWCIGSGIAWRHV